MLLLLYMLSAKLEEGRLDYYNFLVAVHLVLCSNVLWFRRDFSFTSASGSLSSL